MGILDEAHNLVHVDRRNDYQHPKVFFKTLSELWTAFVGVPISPQDANMMMILFKLAREKGKPKRDNRADGAGYFETLDMLYEDES